MSVPVHFAHEQILEHQGTILVTYLQNKHHWFTKSRVVLTVNVGLNLQSVCFSKTGQASRI